MSLKRIFRSWVFWSLGILLLGCARYYPLAENAIRRYPPEVEILPPPPDEAVVEILPAPPDDNHDRSTATGHEPLLSPVDGESDLIDTIDVVEPIVAGPSSPLSMDVVMPHQVQAGGAATIQVKLANVGERAVADARIECLFDGSLVFPGSPTRHVKRPLDILKRNDTREVLLTLVGTEPGWGYCRFILFGRGLDPYEQQYQIQVVPRVWDLTWVGPESRAAGQRAEYLLRIVNRSQSSLKNLRVHLDSSAVLVPLTLPDGAEESGSGHRWSFVEIPAGAVRILPFEFQCTNPSNQACVAASVTADDVPEEKVDACVEVASPHDRFGLTFEDRQDPVDIDEVVEYLVLVENRSLSHLRDVHVEIDSTPGVEFRGVEAYWEPDYLRLPAMGWRVAKQAIQSDVIGDFPANARLKLIIASRGVKAEDVRLDLRVSSGELPEPVVLSEYTIIKAKDKKP